jgi:Zn-dependent M16 (insulinase) family peptidase
LKSLQERIFNKSQAHLVITCDKSKYEELKKEEFFGLCQMAEKPGYAPWTDHFPLSDIPSQARMIPSPVAFTCTTFPTLSYVHPDTAALGVASHLFDNITLHQKIREQGGAYGSGAVNHSTAGFFCFYAYRDPNIVSSLEAFQDSIENVANGEFSEEDLEEAKLEIIQSLDSPVAPGSRGHIAYAWLREGKTVSVRQKFRDHLLSLTRDDVINAVKRHIAPMFSKGAVVTFSGRELIEKENLLLVSKGKEPLKIEQ